MQEPPIPHCQNPTWGWGGGRCFERKNCIPHGKTNQMHQWALAAPNPRFLPPGPEAANNNVGLQQTWPRCPRDLEQAVATLPV